MSHVYETAAIRIVDWLHHAERDLLGATVMTFNGETGTVTAIKLDDHHGLYFTLDAPIQGSRWWPVSTIRLKT
jgi:hypothetical protein